MLRRDLVGRMLALGALGVAGESVAQTASSRREARAKANEWTLGLAAGLPEDTSFPFASEIARNLNDSGNLRVLTLATPGVANSIKDLMFLDGIDVALTQSDVLHYLKATENLPQIDKQVHYIAALYQTPLHLLARAEIGKIQDLAGRRVAVNLPGAGASVTAPIVFQRLNIRFEPVNVGPLQALTMMRNGEVAALLHVAPKPTAQIAFVGGDSGFKLLPIPADQLADLYTPAVLTAADYPSLIKPGQRVDTVAVHAVLAALERPASNDRSRRIRRFVDLFFERFDRFTGPGYQAAWRDVSLSAQLQGWTRHEYAAERVRTLAATPRGSRPQAGVMPAAEQEKLFQRFLESIRQQSTSR